MKQFFSELKNFPRKCDWVLLLLCLLTSGFGMICMVSATQAEKFGGSMRYVLVQSAGIVLGLIMFAIISSIDIEVMSEHRNFLVAFNVFLLLMLIPFGTDNDTGNRSWIETPIVNIQPAEICKITYIVVMASVMNSNKNRISSIPAVMQMVLHLGIVVGLNMVISSDAGVSLIFVFIFIGMAFAGGVSLIWFALAIGGIAVAFPILWQFLGQYQKTES